MSPARQLAPPRFDPLDPALADDPYPCYARLRRESPVLHLPAHGVWVASRYAEVAAIVRDPVTYSSRLGMSPGAGPGGIVPRPGVGYRIGAPNVRVLIATDPPDHRVFRQAVAGAFSPAAIDALRPRVTALAREQVRTLLRNSRAGAADVFADLAEPVPARVLAELLGVPPQMQAEFRAWSAMITADLAQAGSGVAGIGRGIEMFRFFSRRVRRPGPAGRPAPLLDALAGAARHGVTEQEVLAFCAFLLVAGIETTTHLLTNLIDVLLRAPELADRLRREPALVPVAVEEAIRYDTSVQALWRGTTRAVELAGQRLPAGARVLVLFGSANRDEREFPDPDRFRLDRAAGGHLGFGGGPHYCLGARLARLELAAVLRELLAATRSIRPAGPAVRTGSIVLRGFTRQPVAVEPR
jgi:hypothetical protein